MKRPLILAVAVGLALWTTWVVAQKLRGPAFDGYQVASRPLVQTVVATGRVVAVSRAQVGSPVTGVVLERRVQEGDVVQPGDVLAVLRADELEAAVREADAVVAQLQQSTRPQAQAALREAAPESSEEARGRSAHNGTSAKQPCVEAESKATVRIRPHRMRTPSRHRAEAVRS